MTITIKDTRGKTIYVSDARSMKEAITEALWDNISLRGMDVAGQDLSHIFLCDVDLSYANFHGCDLTQAQLPSAILFRANFESANLKCANLAHTRLNLANLSGANLVGADFGGANLSGANLHNADIYNALFDRANIGGTKLEKIPVFLWRDDPVTREIAQAFK